MSEPGHPVYLNIYDFTPMNSCLDTLGLGAYHTGVELMGYEYCYGVIESDPLSSGIIQMDPEDADYPLNRKLFMGNTTVSEDGLALLLGELAGKYTSGNYHMFRNNCNHFADELVRRLLRVGIPRYVFRTTDCLRYLCCCLPEGLVTGRWAIEAIEQQEQWEEETN